MVGMSPLVPAQRQPHPCEVMPDISGTPQDAVAQVSDALERAKRKLVRYEPPKHDGSQAASALPRRTPGSTLPSDTSASPAYLSNRTKPTGSTYNENDATIAALRRQGHRIRVGTRCVPYRIVPPGRQVDKAFVAEPGATEITVAPGRLRSRLGNIAMRAVKAISSTGRKPKHRREQEPNSYAHIYLDEIKRLGTILLSA